MKGPYRAADNTTRDNGDSYRVVSDGDGQGVCRVYHGVQTLLPEETYLDEQAVATRIALALSFCDGMSDEDLRGEDSTTQLVLNGVRYEIP